MMIVDHGKMDKILRAALEVVGQQEPLRSLDVVLVVHPHDCDGELCWEILHDASKRPLVVLSTFPLALLERRDKGVLALLAQAGVAFTALPQRLAAIVQAADRAKAKTEADPEAVAFVAMFTAEYRPRELRRVTHDLGGAIMTGNTGKIAALTERAEKLGITAASPMELLEKLREAVVESEEPTNAALDRLNRM